MRAVCIIQAFYSLTCFFDYTSVHLWNGCVEIWGGGWSAAPSLEPTPGSKAERPRVAVRGAGKGGRGRGAEPGRSVPLPGGGTDTMGSGSWARQGWESGHPAGLRIRLVHRLQGAPPPGASLPVPLPHCSTFTWRPQNALRPRTLGDSLPTEFSPNLVQAHTPLTELTRFGGRGWEVALDLGPCPAPPTPRAGKARVCFPGSWDTAEPRPRSGAAK